MRSPEVMVRLSQNANEIPKAHKQSTPQGPVQQVDPRVYIWTPAAPFRPGLERPKQQCEPPRLEHPVDALLSPGLTLQAAGVPPPQPQQVMEHGGEEVSYTAKSATTHNADANVPGCIVSTHTNSEDIESGQFSNIVRFLPPLTSPARPATSARPPHKFLHCFSDTKVRLPSCPARRRGPALPASDLSCSDARPHRPTDCFSPLAVGQAEHPD